MNKVKISEIKYFDFGKCIEISNNEVNLVVTLDCGPRIIRFGFIGGENQFCEKADITLDTKFGTWRIMGGHRLWHSPENVPRTYIADNNPVKYEIVENGVHVTQEIEPWTQIQKEMVITLDPNENRVKIEHKLTNFNAWPVELSTWSVTVMEPGGKEIIPLTKSSTGSLPNRSIVLWPYTRFNDERVSWLDQYVVLDVKPAKDESFKMGTNNEEGWAAYIRNDSLFIKRSDYIAGMIYPDSGASYETYTNGKLVEMEILSPLEKLEVEGSSTLIETWELKKGISIKEFTEKNIEDLVSKHILSND
ncbi:hypothetical protein [Pseudobacteroides cellulosolvens]|uniref:DUF4380 domain-containing protein n=1 Tax=Pseudobacteroides cellulosolvens ATCC 35603 = DSM 2933 TaxID=398512 RepID=A0A0L6JLV4_9FIRM|nr:hypothetical protein [Pseudobacteroides cellulosolvens]KNY26739.1 Protein of unknown function DUF4380 [Pseudobacteroides cellulosolvens ATCC 35603 = DSM 2933]